MTECISITVVSLCLFVTSGNQVSCLNMSAWTAARPDDDLNMMSGFSSVFNVRNQPQLVCEPCYHDSHGLLVLAKWFEILLSMCDCKQLACGVGMQCGCTDQCFSVVAEDL